MADVNEAVTYGMLSPGFTLDAKFRILSFATLDSVESLYESSAIFFTSAT